MKNFLLRLMKIIVVPVIFLSYCIICTVPLMVILSILLPVNVITYLFMDKWVFPSWLSDWPLPICIIVDEVVAIGKTT
jgi:hypothetical protein